MANIVQEMDQNDLEISGGTIHSCEICAKVFNSENKLKNHFSRIHNQTLRVFQLTYFK